MTENNIQLRWHRYTLPNGRNIFLTNRPDVVSKDSVQQFLELEKPGIRFMFTDDMVEPPENGPPWHWFPWVPCKNPPIENIFAYINQMSFFNKRIPVTTPAWLHCDSSTMRAPTYFGLFCHAMYPNQVEAVRKSLHVNEESYKQHVSDICEYVAVEFKKQPETKTLIDYWVKKGYEAAYKYYLGMYDMYPDLYKDERVT